MFAQTPRQKKLRSLLRYGLLLLLLAIPLQLVIYGTAIPTLLFPGLTENQIANPAAAFTAATNLPWPKSARIISCRDDHAGWHNDGEFTLVFETDRETLLQWLSQPTPWTAVKWEHGPVRTEVALHAFSTHGLTDHHNALDSPEILYGAHDAKQSTIPWHNGKLLAINPQTRRVYLSSWDF